MNVLKIGLSLVVALVGGYFLLFRFGLLVTSVIPNLLNKSVIYTEFMIIPGGHQVDGHWFPLVSMLGIVIGFVCIFMAWCLFNMPVKES